MSAVEFTKEQEERLREVNPLAEEIIASNKAAVQNAKNKARNKLKGKLLGGTVLGGQFRYPLEALTETTDYLQFTIVEYQPTKQVSGGSLTAGPGSRRIGPAGTKIAALGFGCQAPPQGFATTAGAAPAAAKALPFPASLPAPFPLRES